jgi:hypothetical protein
MMKAQESERMSINSWVDLLSGTSTLALAAAKTPDTLTY